VDEFNWSSVSVLRKEGYCIFSCLDLLQLLLHVFIHEKCLLNHMFFLLLIFILLEQIPNHFRVRNILYLIFIILRVSLGQTSFFLFLFISRGRHVKKLAIWTVLRFVVIITNIHFILVFLIETGLGFSENIRPHLGVFFLDSVLAKLRDF